jgi:2-polyprenyl-3-methyl-5-hydroxy-6-metoxy-1,4-benzoquinol methylase
MLDSFNLEKLEYENKIFHHKGISLPSVSSERTEKFFYCQDTSFWHRHRSSVIVSVLRKYGKHSNIVDVGGGDGFNAIKLKEAGFDVVLVEPDPLGSATAKANGVENVICTYFDSNLVKERSIPCIGLFDVLEHIEDDKGFLCSLNSLMSNNGEIIIAVPAHNYLWSEKDNWAKHFRRYSLRELEEVVRNSGFSVVFSTYIFSFLLLPFIIRIALPYRLSKRKSNGSHLEKLQKKARSYNSAGFLEPIIKKLCKLEEFILKRGKKIFFGTSCVIIAQKKR